jgi:hypothetical protein
MTMRREGRGEGEGGEGGKRAASSHRAHKTRHGKEQMREHPHTAPIHVISET